MPRSIEKWIIPFFTIILGKVCPTLDMLTKEFEFLGVDANNRTRRKIDT